MPSKIAENSSYTTSERSNRKRGRPRKDAHLADFESVGEPPSDVLAIGRWLQDVVAMTGYQAKEGRGSREVRDGIRKTCKAAARLLPSAMTARALGLIEQNDDEDIDPDEAPPADPLRVNEWFLVNLVNDVFAQITGTADAQLSAELRESSLAAVKVWPPDVMVEAHRVLREDMASRERAAGGPELVRFADITVEPVGEDDGARPSSLNQRDWQGKED